jgi:phosphoenolpyruvate---glycerone phosphotransferase subunit DhaL
VKLTSADIAAAIERIDAGIAPIRDALNAADRHLGDGDTGMTVAQVVAAWKAAAGALPDDVGAAFVALGRETGRATGSSLGSVMAMGLSAAGRAVRGRNEIRREALVTMLGAATAVIAERSGAAAGDKTILDSLLAIERALARCDEASDALEVALAAAETARSEYREREAKIGRARMYGERSRGHDDPGMLAACLLLGAAR